MLEDPTKPRTDGPKVVIFASNFQEATEIRQICSSFIDEKSVYTDAEDCVMDFNVSVLNWNQNSHSISLKKSFSFKNHLK